MFKYVLAFIFLSCIPLANWLIQNVGSVCVPNGPCLIPVFPGVMAPSGVLVIGLALATRDAVQERFGKGLVASLVVVGAMLSFAFSPAQIAVASAAAFFVSEMVDFAVYTWLRLKSQASAILLSGFFGSVLDSLLFSWVAFGTLKWSVGLVVAKMYASLIFAAYVFYKQRKMP